MNLSNSSYGSIIHLSDRTKPKIKIGTHRRGETMNTLKSIYCIFRGRSRYRDGMRAENCVYRPSPENISNRGYAQYSENGNEMGAVCR